jgi:hypothetical protein
MSKTIYEMTTDELNEYRAGVIRIIRKTKGDKVTQKMMLGNLDAVNDEAKHRRDMVGIWRGLALGEFPLPITEDGSWSFVGGGFVSEHPQTAIVRCVHEGVCPVCGREAEIVDDRKVQVENPKWPDEPYMTDLQEYDGRTLTTVECPAGHRATAEPTYHDWVGWIDDAKAKTWMPDMEATE